MRKMGYLGVLIAFFAIGLAPISFAEAQENTINIPEPVPGGETPVEQSPNSGENTISIPEPVPGGETPVEQEPGPDSDQYVTIPEPQPSTPVGDSPSGGNDVTELPDTGGPSGLALLAGALLLGGGLVVRRIVK